MTDKTKSGNYDLNINQKIDEIKNEEANKLFENEKAQRLDELKQYVKSCYESSVQWRKTSFEGNWDKWYRNAHSVYDPDIKEKKEDWQITMFIPLTIRHKERAKSQIVKTLIGTQPNFDIDIRPGGDTDQAEMIKDLILYYMDKSQFALGFNDEVDQASIYGSGFAKSYWQTIREKRKIRKPVYDGLGILEKLSYLIQGKSQEINEYKEEEKEIETFDGIVYNYVDIHDLFPDPKDPTFKKSWVIHRTIMNYGDLVNGANQGWYNKEAVERLKDVKEDETPTEDKSTEYGDRGETIPPIPRTDYGKPHTILEFWGRLPRKWIYLDKKLKENEKDEMIPAKCLCAYEGIEVLEVIENDSYTGENLLLKCDYLRNTGLHYGMGIPELLWGIQEEINELRNQRVDNGVIALNQMSAILEDAIIDEEDFVSKPGGVIRIRGKRGGYDDIRQAMMPLPLGNIPNFSYQETLELEREAQETTGINRVTFGTGGQFSKDVNQTATGMNLLKQSSLELMSYYSMIIELSAFIQVLRHFYVLIYKNITPEKLSKILGEERAKKFQLLPVEELEQYYKFKPTGTFTMENKIQKAQALMQFKALYEEAPFMKPIALAKRIARLLEIENPDEIMMTEEEFQDKLVEMQGQLPSQSPEGQPMPQKPQIQGQGMELPIT